MYHNFTLVLAALILALVYLGGCNAKPLTPVLPADIATPPTITGNNDDTDTGGTPNLCPTASTRHSTTVEVLKKYKSLCTKNNISGDMTFPKACIAATHQLCKTEIYPGCEVGGRPIDIGVVDPNPSQTDAMIPITYVCSPGSYHNLNLSGNVMESAGYYNSTCPSVYAASKGFSLDCENAAAKFCLAKFGVSAGAVQQNDTSSFGLRCFDKLETQVFTHVKAAPALNTMYNGCNVTNFIAGFSSTSDLSTACSKAVDIFCTNKGYVTGMVIYYEPITDAMGNLTNYYADVACTK